MAMTKNTRDAFQRQQNTVQSSMQAQPVRVSPAQQAINDNKRASAQMLSNLQSQGQSFFNDSQNRINKRFNINQGFASDAQKNLALNTQNMGNISGAFMSEQQRLSDLANRQMTDATQVYQTLTPHYNDLINRSSNNAKEAMTLQQAMNPNNKVAASVRDLYDEYGNALRNEYNTEASRSQAGYNTLSKQAQTGYTDLAGQTQSLYDQYGEQSQNRYFDEGAAARARFEEAAQGENRLGLQNFGVLSALGAQAAGQMGGNAPITLGQQMGNLAIANRQAGEAFANTQRRMQGLQDQGLMTETDMRRLGLGSRDQYASTGLSSATGLRATGLSTGLGLQEKGLDTSIGLRTAGLAGQQDLRSQGLNQGLNQSNLMYQMGQQAQDTYRNALLDRESLTDRNLGRQSSLRNEIGMYGGNIFNAGQGQESLRLGNTLMGNDLQRQAQLGRLSDIDQLRSGQMDFNSQMAGMQMGRDDINTERTLGQIQARLQAQAAEDASRRALLGAGIGALGTIGGAVVGGPMGAAIGGGIASMMSSGGSQQVYQPMAYQSQMMPQQQVSRFNLGVSQMMPQQPMYNSLSNNYRFGLS